MRKRFEQQMTIGRLPIGETEIPTKKRSDLINIKIQDFICQGTKINRITFPLNSNI